MAARPRLALLAALLARAIVATTCGFGGVSNTCISTVAGRAGAGGIGGATRGVAVAADGLVVFTSPSQVLAFAGVPVTLASGARRGRATAPAFAGVAVGPDGAYYVADTNAHTVTRIDLSGDSAVIAGVFEHAGFGGNGRRADNTTLSGPVGVAVSAAGDVYIADSGNNMIRVVRAATGLIEAVAGSGSSGRSGDGGAAVNATLAAPTGIALSSTGDLFIADSGNNVVRVVRAGTGVIANVAGSGAAGYAGDGGSALIATLKNPTGVAVAPSGDVFIADADNLVIRVVRAASGLISTFAGSGLYGNSGDGGAAASASLSDPSGVAVAANGDVYIADTSNKVVRVVHAATGFMEAFAGSSSYGSGGDGGFAANASLATPSGVAVSSKGDVFIADWGNSAIRVLRASSGLIERVAGSGAYGYRGDGGAAVSAALSVPFGIAVSSSDDIYYADTYNHAVRVVRASSGTIATYAGTGVYGFSGNGAAAVNATLANPSGVAVSATGDVYICDTNNHMVRVVRAATGIITTVAGSGADGSTGNGGDAVSAALSYPNGVAVSSVGDIYIADTFNSVIRVVRAATGFISLFAGTGAPGFAGNGGLATAAQLAYPYGIAISSLTNDVYIADSSNHQIRVVRATGLSTGIIENSAGVGEDKYAGDGSLAVNAALSNPLSVAISLEGAIFIADSGNNLVREVPLAAPVTCRAGFFCSVGLNPVPCTDPATFCPVNSLAPVPVSPGYAAAPSLAPTGAVVFAAQRECPSGSFCPPGAGLTAACYGGSYGTTRLATLPSHCALCAAASYLAEAGRAVAAGGASPCLACPPGSVAAAPGSAACALCPPATFRAAGDAACRPCASGTASLFGASACFATAAGDGVSIAPGTVAFQRLPALNAGVATPAEKLTTVISVSLPIAAIAVIPILIVAAAALCLRASPRALSLLKYADLYSIRPPFVENEAPLLTPTPLGGAVTLATLGTILALIASTIAQYRLSNTLLLQSSLPVTLPALDSFADLPPARVAANVAAGVSDAALLALTAPGAPGAGFAVTVATMGARCATLRGNASTLAAGAFAYAGAANAATGAARHTFTCARCLVDQLSRLTLVFDASCQSFAVTIAAASASGGVSAASAHVANAAAPGAPGLASVGVTFPLVLEVVSDGVGGAAPRESDGLVLGGRSVAGLVALPATDASGAAGAGGEAPVTLTIELPLQQSFTLYTLSPVLSPLGLLAAIAAFLGLLGAGATLMSAYENAVYFIGLSRTKAAPGAAPGAAPEAAPAAAGGKAPPKTLLALGVVGAAPPPTMPTVVESAAGP